MALIRAREKAVESVAIEMRTRGSFPGDIEFRSEGTLRVLSTTHFHTLMKQSFGDGLTAEFETIKTPAGVMMRESDPAQGEVFVRMDAELVEALDSASAVLGGSAQLGAGADMASGPLGSAMLSDLDQRFDLKVDGPKVIGGQECWSVGGALRAEAASDPGDEFGPADRVEVLVRRADTAVVRMTMLAAGAVIVDVEILEIVLDQPMSEESFELEIPPGTKVIDAMNHPPALAQIQRVFAEAEAAGWQRGSPAKSKDETGSKGSDAREGSTDGADGDRERPDEAGRDR